MGTLKLGRERGRPVSVSVSAEINGKNTNFGKKEFRVKNVPDPKPFFGGKSGSDNIPRKGLVSCCVVLSRRWRTSSLTYDSRLSAIRCPLRFEEMWWSRGCNGPGLSSGAQMRSRLLQS